jgi:hemerythrin-like domain-containing protein
MEHVLRILFDEHEVIVRAIGMARDARALVGVDNAAYEDTMSELIRFFRQYADHYHHYKEEQILFPDMAKKSELMQQGILAEMLDNHEDFRARIRAIELALQNGDHAGAAERMDAYGEALLDHIAVENDELFIAAEDLFNAEESEKLFFRFVDIDSELGTHKKQDLVAILDDLVARK